MDRVTDLQRRLDEELPRLAAEHDVPGVSVAVLADGRVVESATGVVNLRTGVEVTPDSVFAIQSVTKVWTATLVMQLVDDGLLDLDVPVRSYLPRFHTADPDASADVTARHLLTHTGGFEGDLWAATTCGGDALRRFVEDLVTQAPQHSRPGEMYSYCSAGYGVLGHLVETLRGLPYAAALRRHLAEPLQIREIAFEANEALAYRTAIGHAPPRPGAAQEPLRLWALMPPSNPAAGNQLAMSARALVAFGGLHGADGLAPDGGRVLSAAGAQAMRERQVGRPAVLDHSAGQGLGWSLPGRPGVVEHWGGDIGVAALLRVAPQHGVALALLTNGGAATPLARDLLDPILADLTGIPEAPPLPRPDAHQRTARPERYLGRYATRPTLNEVTTDDDGRLWLTRSERHEAITMAEAGGTTLEPRRSELRQVDGDTFVLTDSAGRPSQGVEFVGTDDAGRARFLHTGRAAPRST